MRLASLLCVHLALIAAAVVPAGAEERSANRTIEYLYVDANAGGASGGHNAVKMGNTVYHFQHFPNGLFRLVRDEWRHFRHIYNNLGNRTLFITSIEVSMADYYRVRKRLIRLYLIQNKHLQVFQALQTESLLLEAFLNPSKVLRLRGAGLFSQIETGDRHGKHLRENIRETYGPDYLHGAMRRLALAIGSTPVTVRNLTDVKLSRDSFPGVGSLYSQRYLELLLRQEALSVLANARSLQTKVLLDPTRVSTNDMDYHLSRRERLQLQHYAKQLTASVLQLVDSRRSDNGYPLLLAIARYQAVQRSLEANRLFLLDAFSDAALMVNRQTLAQQRTLTPKLANRARQVYEKNRKAVFAMEQLDESAYNRLESAGSRYYEVQRGLLGNSSVRVERGRLLPSRSRPLRFDSSHAKRAKLFGYLEVAKTNQLAYWNQLRKIYAYRLIRRNCATELSRGINSAFSRPEEVRKALGDFLAPGEEFTFIPFRLFHEVQRRFRVSAIKILPSYRKRRLAQMYDQENPAKVYWRETNVLTSTIYDGIAKDSTFLLFTDDVVWPRPFYGMLNLFYGLVHAGAGLFTLPVDKGKRMVEGLRGVFFSLPELFFFNIRKGSFEFVEDDALDPSTVSPTFFSCPPLLTAMPISYFFTLIKSVNHT